jgi:hypothetical protein
VFNTNLTVGSKSTDVMNLQKVLNMSADTKVAASGAGSPGMETSTFGPATKAAVIKFQTKYGISPAAGYVGAITRAKLNSMGGSVSTTPTTPGTTLPTGGALSVSAGSQPANSLAPQSASRIPFTTVVLTAGSADVTVNSITVERSGLAQDAVTAVGSRKAGKGHKNIQQDFDRSKLYDVTRAFIDDPFKQPNQRIYVFVKNESENILKLLDKRTKEMSGNVTMGHRADMEDQKNQADYFKNMQAMGVHPDQIAHMWRKKQAEKLKRAQQSTNLATGTVPMQQAPVDDLDDRIAKFKQQKSITNPINDDEWNRRLAAARS